jgi:thermitase
MMHRYVVHAGIAAVVSTLIAAPLAVGIEHNSAAQPGHAPAPTFARDAIIVKYRPGTTEDMRARITRSGGGTGRTTLARITPDVERVKLNGSTGVAASIRTFEDDPSVEYAEPDYVVTRTATSTDPQVTTGRLWGMYGDASSPANPYGSQAMEAWTKNFVGSTKVYVGVIDEGIDHSHPDLAANVWNNPFDPADGIDNDGNGYVDDVHGWDFVHRDRTVYDGGTGDTHGTHVAGTMGGVGGNGIGVAGVNWNVTMISTKFLGANGGYISDAVKALDYLVDLKRRHGLNIVASNNSWGGGGYSQTLLDAINRSGDAGMLFVAAAGNGGTDGVGDNTDATANYPSNYQCITRFDTQASRGYDCVVSVAAITSSGARSSFSNYGAATVDLGAPGSSIVSTLPGSTYGSYSGTSMATPHVTGAIALCAAANPMLRAADLRSRLLQSTASTPSLAANTVTGGRLNAAAMLDACTAATSPAPDTQAPSPPGSFTKLLPAHRTANLDTKVRLTWGSSSGASSYAVCIDTTNDNSCGGSWTNVGTAISATASVNRRTTYYWQVRAVNAGGTTQANAGTWWRFSSL